MTKSNDKTIYIGPVYEDDLPLTCGGAEYDSVYWYWNGELLQSDDITHRLIGNSEELIGVYQCFKLTTDGALYQHTWRVFERCKSW